MVQEAALLEHTALFQIRNGQVTCEQAATDPAAATYLRVSRTSSRSMPKLQFHRES